MDRRDTGRLFRTRLSEAMARAGMSQSELARRVGIDRSTLSQLLNAEGDRLPRADTVAGMAAVLQISLDWLLGLSGEAQLGADILEQSMQIETSEPGAAQRKLAQWRDEAVGYKIRYVPSTIPDLLKIPEVIDYEYAAFQGMGPETARMEAEERLEYSRLPETDVEACNTTQAIAGLARGEGIWRQLPRQLRIAQLEHAIRLVDELYPTFRWFLYDGMARYSVPMTIFGPQRAAIYMGQMYFVFTTTEHIRVLTRHFDGLIRNAAVQPPDVWFLLRRLCDELINGGEE